MSKKTICDFCGKEGVAKTQLGSPPNWASIKCSSYSFTSYGSTTAQPDT